MIKLTVNPKSNPVVHNFQKKVVLIGTGSASEIDLILDDSGQDCIQIKILDQKKYFLAINVTHNPLIKVNGHTFRKKILKNDDLLQIDQTSIIFNDDLASQTDNSNENKYYISDDFDDEGENWNATDLKKKAILSPYEIYHPLTNWKLWIVILLSFLSFAFICSSVVYVKILESTERYEIKAAEGVADVAMALTYAQINHINPLTQNWSNPDFLKNNFAAIVPSDYSFLDNIDSHGEFNNCPYLLRIYTNNDFSTFLVVALPEPRILQSIVPKKAIFVHSKTMELRKIEDLRALNRLLVNPNTLDGVNGVEITNLVKNGTLIPLSVLSLETKSQGFSPPKALSLRRPGAENLIYNAPRYYQFSETYVRRALSLIKSTENASYELARLQQEMLQMSKLPNLVLYTSDGIESAIQAEKAFSAFTPFAKFLNAYVIFNSEGYISGSHLIMEEDSNRPLSTFSNMNFLKEDFNEIAMLNETAPSTLDSNEAKHPLQLQLSALSSTRSQSLQTVAKKINDLLNDQINAYHPEFSGKLADLAIQFQQKDMEEKDKITKTLTELYEDYSSLPLSEVLSHTKTAGLEHIIAEILRDRAVVLDEQDLSDELVGAQLQMIKKAKTFEELHESISKAVDLLSLKSIPNLEVLIAYQNQTKSLVTEKLEEFLLSPRFPLPKTEFQLNNRNILNHILEISWITDPCEASFYLGEFDLQK
jgi:hypothetical protein